MSAITGELPMGFDPALYELLKTIDDPAQLRALERRQLRQLADELRAFFLESVSKTGGHLSSNLGTVELTIALHYVFDTPEDRIVWDVGHQTYAHKILTGRREAMTRLRMLEGISGFPRRAESKYDTFGTAHSSTSIPKHAANPLFTKRTYAGRFGSPRNGTGDKYGASVSITIRSRGRNRITSLSSFAFGYVIGPSTPNVVSIDSDATSTTGRPHASISVGMSDGFVSDATTPTALDA